MSRFATSLSNLKDSGNSGNNNNNNNAIAKLPNHETTRFDVFTELFESEKSYYEDLTYIFMHISPGLAAARGVAESSSFIQQIFGGVEKIRLLSKKLLAGMDLALRECPTDPQVSDLFIALSGEFVVYSERISNQPQALAAYEDAIKDKRIAEAMKILFASKQARARNYRDLFSLEYQRLCRYGLFLDRLVKVSSKDHPELENLRLAARKMNEVVLDVNTIRGEHERKVQLQKVAESIEFSGGYPAFPIVVPNRKILYHGRMDKIRTLFNKPYYWFIFNDIIVYALEVTSLFRPTKYSVVNVLKIDQYFTVKSHDQANNSKHWISIFQGLKHVGRHYDALNYDNKQKMLNAFEEAISQWTVKFIQQQAKERFQEKMARDRQVCSLCPKILSRFGRHRCGFCSQDVCGDCFNCTFADKRCCVECGKQRGVLPLDERLKPGWRNYIVNAPQRANSANMLTLSKNDELEVYAIIAQRWGIGRNATTKQVGVFPLTSSTLDPLKDRGENQNFGIFAGIYDPQEISPTKHTFNTLDVGDVLVITYDNKDGWMFAKSLKTGKYGYVHYTNLRIVRGTTIDKFHKNNQK